MKWYVINCVNTKEVKIKESIEKVIEMDKHSKVVEQVLVPREKYFQVRMGKKIKAERNFYPGYIFIECELNGELMRSIQTVKGVSGFLKNNGIAIPMPKRDVENMLSKAGEIDKVTDEVDITQMYSIGQSVSIIDGPFATFSGSIKSVNNSKKTVQVDVSIFSRLTEVDLGIEQISIN